MLPGSNIGRPMLHLPTPRKQFPWKIFFGQWVLVRRHLVVLTDCLCWARLSGLIEFLRSSFVYHSCVRVGYNRSWRRGKCKIASMIFILLLRGGCSSCKPCVGRCPSGLCWWLFLLSPDDIDARQTCGDGAKFYEAVPDPLGCGVSYLLQSFFV